MSYKMTSGAEQWKIDTVKFDPLNRWQLFHAVDQAWKRLRLFATPEAAMVAVGEGNTGVPMWDAGTHNPADFTLDKWTTERR